MKLIGLVLLAALTLGASPAFPAEHAVTGTMTGRFTLNNGEPLSDGKVYFFRVGSGPPPSQSSYWRTPDEIAPMDREGTFTAGLPEGSYYIAATKKQTRDLIGPPVEGDYVYPYSRKELTVDRQVYTVKRGETTDIGTIADAVPFRKKAVAAREGTTAIAGTITDSAGKPVSGAIAFAYPTPVVTGKPQYVSERTGSDGKYLLRVGEGGTYYIKIRTTLTGGQPETGEILGTYGKDGPHPVTAVTGEITTGIDITGKTFSRLTRTDPSRRRQLSQPPHRP
jgi:hypothetical protein